MVWKNLANLVTGFQLFNCTYRYWPEKIWLIEHYLPKFSNSTYGILSVVFSTKQYWYVIT